MKNRSERIKTGCVLIAALSILWGAVGCAPQDSQSSSPSDIQASIPRGGEEASQPSGTESSQNEVSSDSPEPSQAPKVLEIGQKLRVGKLNVIVTDVYRSQYLNIDGEIRYPRDGKIFVIAQITLENTFGEFHTFRASDALKPSVDGTVIELKGLANVYPDYLDNAHNLVNRGTVTVNAGDSKKGYVMFEVPVDFKTGEIACFDETGALAGSFAFENLPQEISTEPSQTSVVPSEQGSTEPSQTSDATSGQTGDGSSGQTAAADGLTFTLLELMEDNGSKLGIEQYADVNKFWQVRLKITNNTNTERAFTYNDFAVVCGETKHDPLFSASGVEMIGPGMSIEGEIIFAVEKSDTAGLLYYFSRGTKVEEHPLFLLVP